MKKVILNLLGAYRIKHILTALNHWKYRNTIIVTHTMAKVGSTTITATLRNLMPKHYYIFDVHFLSKEWMDKMVAQLKEGDELDYGLITRNEILKTINYFPKKRIKVISLVRDPIARDISSVFETWSMFEYKNRDINDVPNSEIISNLLSSYHSVDNLYPHRWLDTELKQFTGIDVFQQPFDKEQGYSIYTNGNIDLLCIKLEYLNHCYKRAFKEFLDLEINELVAKNKAEDRDGIVYEKYKTW